jgi:hypothetical protein
MGKCADVKISTKLALHLTINGGKRNPSCQEGFEGLRGLKRGLFRGQEPRLRR